MQRLLIGQVLPPVVQGDGAQGEADQEQGHHQHPGGHGVAWHQSRVSVRGGFPIIKIRQALGDIMLS